MERADTDIGELNHDIISNLNSNPKANLTLI